MSLFRRNRHFRVLLIAQIVSYCGDWFATVALIGVVEATTHSAFLVALVWVLQSLPQFFAAPWAGSTADRFNRRTIMVSVSAAQVVVTLGYLLVHTRSTIPLGFGVEAGVAALAAFFGPASQAAVPNLVDEADLPTANAIMGSTWGAMLAIGAGLGGLFTKAFGRDAAFIADAASFAIAGLLILSIKAPFSVSAAHGAVRPRMRPIHDTKEALTMARTRPQMMALLASKASFGLGAGVVGLLPVLARRRFHGGDGILGLFLAVRGVAALVGPFVVRNHIGSDVRRVIRICGIAMTVYGVAYAGASSAPFLGLALVGVFFAHCGGGIQWTYSSYGLQLVTPDEFRGRIFAADYALVTLTMSVSGSISGAVANASGPAPVMFVLAVVSFCVGISYLAVTRHLASEPAR